MTDQYEFVIGDEPSSDFATAAMPRVFFPANREDALVHLGALAISGAHCDILTAYAVQTLKPALVADGLRATEEELIRGGSVNRFPVLLELTNELSANERTCIPYSRISGLVFRSESEAGEFRLRPVHEFDPLMMPYSIEPDRFGLAGEARFAVALNQEDCCTEPARTAERICSAIQSLLMLGEREPSLRSSVIAIFGSDPCSDGKLTMSVRDIMAAACGHSLVGVHSVVIGALTRAFLASRQSVPNTILASISGEFADNSADPYIARYQDRWMMTAESAMASVLPLDGQLLADEGEIILRAALLALFVDDLESLRVFLHAPKPAGSLVVAIASLFMGLKRGFLESPWAEKSHTAIPFAILLPAMAASIASSDEGSFFKAFKLIVTDESTSFILGNHVVFRWTGGASIEEQGLQDAAELARQFSSHDLEVVSCGDNPARVSVRWSKRLQLRASYVRAAGLKWIRLEYEDSPATGKSGVIMTSRELPFWQPCPEMPGIFFCDLPEIPASPARGMIEESLFMLLRTGLTADGPGQ